MTASARTSTRHTSRRRTAAVGALGAALVAATVGLAAPQSASAATDDGWLRVGHLSPDTKSVDVEL